MNHLSAHGRLQRKLQPPVGAQLELEPPFLETDAKVDIFSSTSLLSQDGHFTFSVSAAFITSFSNSIPQARHSNS
jgi:hypothetical protein